MKRKREREREKEQGKRRWVGKEREEGREKESYAGYRLFLVIRSRLLDGSLRLSQRAVHGRLL